VINLGVPPGRREGPLRDKGPDRASRDQGPGHAKRFVLVKGLRRRLRWDAAEPVVGGRDVAATGTGRHVEMDGAGAVSSEVRACGPGEEREDASPRKARAVGGAGAATGNNVARVPRSRSRD
jgi:hypothetical protein